MAEAVIKFYLRELPRCPCKKSATVEVFGSGNASYGKFCDKCGTKKKKDLEKFWQSQTPEVQQNQRDHHF